MNKRWISVLLAATLLLPLTACARGGFSRETTVPVTARPTVRVTVPEGYTVYDIALLLEDKEVCASEEFIQAVMNPPEDNAFAASIPNPEDRPFLLEGYVFPDTYEFFVGESAPAALDRFLKNTAKKLTQEHYERAEELGYTMDEILIMASMIQKESGFAAEDPKVSSVLHNRLNNKSFPMLQFNVTFEYLDNAVQPYYAAGHEGDEEYSARARYNHLYNTYVRTGLPVGPICNPGLGAINAALYPADTEYLYFLTDKDKNYYYSKTYAEHSALWKIYQH